MITSCMSKSVDMFTHSIVFASIYANPSIYCPLSQSSLSLFQSRFTFTNDPNKPLVPITYFCYKTLKQLS